MFNFEELYVPSNADARNCRRLLSDNDIDDVHELIHKKSISKRNEEVQDVTVPFVA